MARDLGGASGDPYANADQYRTSVYGTDLGRWANQPLTDAQFQYTFALKISRYSGSGVAHILAARYLDPFKGRVKLG